jgi:hypothetical protein
MNKKLLLNLFLKSKQQANKIYFGLLFLFFFNFSNAQVANYTFGQASGTYSSISGLNPDYIFSSGTNNNVARINFPTGFIFVFNGASYSSCLVSTNGFITFGSLAPAINNYTPISSNDTGYLGAISALGKRLINTNSPLVYKTIGVAPNRTFVVEWSNVKRYEARNDSYESFNFQIRLSEFTNKIDVVYGFCDTNYSTDLTVQVGLRGINNADFNNRGVTNNWPTSGAGGNNGATCNTGRGTGELPMSGLTYTWTPSVCKFTNFSTVRPITNVALSNLNNPSSASSTFAYEDFTASVAPANVFSGQAYTLVVKGNTSPKQTIRYTAFIDWNKDNDFNDSEESYEIGSITNSTGSDDNLASLYFTVPTGAILGSTKMRIIGHRDSYNTNPCSSIGGYSEGQVEDYTVNIQAPCSAAPSVPTINVTKNPVCTSEPFTLSVVSPETNGITYKWETSSNGNAPWVSAPTAPIDYFSTDFSSGIPTGSVSYGDAAISSGEMVLTPATSSKKGGYVITKAPVPNINAFTVQFDYKMAGGNGADGMSLNYASDIITTDAGLGEEGEGSGIRLILDTYDNDGIGVGGTATGSRIRIKYNNQLVFANGIDAFLLRTAGGTDYNTVMLSVDNDGYLTLKIRKNGGATTTIVSNLLLQGYKSVNKSTWRYKFSSRTGLQYDRQSIDNLSIRYLDLVNSNPSLTTSQTAPTYYRAVATCSNGGSGTPSASIFVDASLKITTQPVDLTICENTGGSFTVETSVSSATYQWQYSPDGTNWTNVDTAQLPYVSGYTTKTLTLTNAPVGWNGNRVRCVVTNSGCSTNSNAVLLTIKALPTPPTQGTITRATCAVPTGSVILNGLPSGDWTIVSNPVTVTTTGTGTTTTISGLVPNTYTFTVSSTTSTCTSVASADVVIPGLVTNNWSSSGWSIGTPTVNHNIIFLADYTSATGSAGDLTACSCQVNLTAKVTIKAGATLAITNSVTVASAASLKFEDQASLYQKNDNAINTGVITYERISIDMKDQDYVYWSSPVVNQKFSTLSLGTKSWFAYDIATNSWKYAVDNMETGRGYSIKSRNAGPFPYDQKVAFKGTPNNGVLTLATPTKANEYILVGNPYPSALSADDFVLANKDILDGTLYFWAHRVPLKYDGTKWDYSSSDYATYNLSGGVSGGPEKGTASGSGSAKPSGNIGAGQSFFINATVGGANVTFKNSMRVAGENIQFYRSSKNNKTTALEKNRVWLNLTNKTGAFKQMLVGYIEGATNDYESIYDGLSYNMNDYINFYSINKGQELTIQGRALPFKETDLVPLGYSSTIAGSFSIGIDNVDGSFTNQGIYLEDKVIGAIHNLRERDYTFTTAKGTFNDRFVLRYTNKTLGTDEFELAENTVLVAVANKAIKINTFSQTIDKVFIYDVSGKLIYKKEKIGNPTLTIENLTSSNQVLLVKVVLDNKHVETKKVIF